MKIDVDVATQIVTMSRTFQNDKELFDYLVWLSGELKSKDKSELAEEVRIASRFASGSPSEFLHEAQTVLKKVKANCISVLSETQLADAASAIEQIESAFKKVGGA